MWGPAEWIALVGGVSTVLGALATLVVAVTKLRRENTQQHADNNKANAERFGELREDIVGLGASVDRRMDRLEDSMTDAIDRHEGVYHRRRRFF